MPAEASALGATLAALLAATATASPGPPGPQLVLVMADPAITESSGLAVSARHPGLIWTHNDGGEVAQVLALDRGGATVARVTLAGIDPYDPEALAAGLDEQGSPALFLGDIGDNDAARLDVSVFRFAEPGQLGDQTVAATWFRFTYPDGPHDAEALLVDRAGRIAVVTKEVSGAAVYLAPRVLVSEGEGINRLTRVADAPALVTDGARLPGGGYLLRTYTSVFRYDGSGRETGSAVLPPQPQGESLALDGARLLVGSEGVSSQVLAVPLPGPRVVQGAVPESPCDSPRGAVGLRVGTALAVGVSLLVGLGLGMLIRRPARRRRG